MKGCGATSTKKMKKSQPVTIKMEAKHLVPAAMTCSQGLVVDSSVTLVPLLLHWPCSLAPSLWLGWPQFQPGVIWPQFHTTH